LSSKPGSIKRKTSKANVDSQNIKRKGKRKALQGYKEQCLVVPHYESICRGKKKKKKKKEGGRGEQASLATKYIKLEREKYSK
jgi:hypothetical protein